MRKLTNQWVVNPLPAAIQTKTRRGIESMRLPKRAVEDHTLIFATGKLIHQYSGAKHVPDVQTYSIDERSSDLEGHRYERGPHHSTKCSMDIPPGAQLTQKTAKQKFVDSPNHLVRVVALATVYRDISVRTFEESYEPWNVVD
ncbi:hypothetical protein TNCV_3183141 [Trichonephila clavipes]|uniref:Uncharacterized protein n=1 Tax=Trichonephila clavipes TaxID=2585209 RepID=A0A8X6SFW2_TRICX|nr:hypothetical protein TNCV_3183141 [Trichonephila clavipes]